MSERDAINRASLGNVDLMSQSTISNTGDQEKAITNLKKQILELQSENSSLKRQIPRMKDMEGSDVTENMKQLCDDLAKAEQSNEQWQNRYAESEQNLSRFKCKMQNELDSRDTQIAQLKSRAKALEEDNEKLKRQAENDQSKLYHLQNDADISEQHDLSLDAFEQSFEPDDVSQIRQQLAEKIEENGKLSQQCDETIKLMEDMKKTIETQAEAIKRLYMRENDEDDSLFALPKAVPLGSDADVVVANVLFILQQLDENKRDQNALQEDIITLLRNHGYDISAKSAAELSKDYENTFRSKFNKRRNQIKLTNEELADECRMDNTELAHHLNQLSNDSVFSSSAAFGQQISSAMDMARGTLGAEVLNKTMDVAQDLGTVVIRMNGLREICNQLFEKLRGTALFLQSLLDTLEDSDEGRELLRKINEIKLDLDKSMAEARDLVEEVKKAEKSVHEFHEILQQSITNQTVEENTLLQGDLFPETQLVDASKQEIDRLKLSEVQCESLKVSLNKELANKELLSGNILELKKQRDENELNFKQEIQALKKKIGEQEEASVHFQKLFEEKCQVVEGLEREIKEKNDELVAASQKVERLKQLLLESAQSIELVRSQLTESSKSYEAAITASTEQQKEFEQKLAAIVKMEEEIIVLKSEKESLMNRVQAAEIELSSVRDENAVISRGKADLVSHEVLIPRYQEQQSSVAKGNEMLYQKISNQDLDESLENTFTEGAEEDDVSSFDHFSEFLRDCSKRSNKLVQMVKRVEALLVQDNFKVHYLQPILSETRSIRLLLHKVSKFFDSQKEDLGKNNKKLGRAIRDELKSIYDTLQIAAETSHTKFAAMKRDSPAGSQRK